MESVRGERGDSAVSKNVTALGMIMFCAKEANSNIKTLSLIL